MNVRTIFALVPALFAASVLASSFPTFQQLDVNGDGMLNEDELEVLDQFRGEESEFAEADGNDDGGLDSAEYQIWVDLETGTARSDDVSPDRSSSN